MNGVAKFADLYKLKFDSMYVPVTTRWDTLRLHSIKFSWLQRLDNTSEHKIN